MSPPQININLSIFLHPQADASSGAAAPSGPQVEVSQFQGGSVVTVSQIAVRPTSTTRAPDYGDYYEDDSALRPVVEENELEGLGGLSNFKPLGHKSPNEEKDVVLAI